MWNVPDIWNGDNMGVGWVQIKKTTLLNLNALMSTDPACTCSEHVSSGRMGHTHARTHARRATAFFNLATVSYLWPTVQVLLMRARVGASKTEGRFRAREHDLLTRDVTAVGWRVPCGGEP